MRPPPVIVFSFIRAGLHRSKKDARGVYYELRCEHPAVRMAPWELVRFAPWSAGTMGEVLAKGTHTEVREAAQRLEARDPKTEAQRWFGARP